MRTDLAKQVKAAILHKCDVSEKTLIKKKSSSVHCCVFFMQLFMTAVSLFTSFQETIYPLRYIPFQIIICFTKTHHFYKPSQCASLGNTGLQIVRECFSKLQLYIPKLVCDDHFLLSVCFYIFLLIAVIIFLQNKK